MPHHQTHMDPGLARSAPDRATIAPVNAMSAAEVMSAIEMPAAPAVTASENPSKISPMDSAWERNECTVARTSLVVRRFTQITLTVRVTLNAMRLTSSTPAPPMIELIGDPRDVGAGQEGPP